MKRLLPHPRGNDILKKVRLLERRYLSRVFVAMVDGLHEGLAWVATINSRARHRRFPDFSAADLDQLREESKQAELTKIADEERGKYYFAGSFDEDGRSILEAPFGLRPSKSEPGQDEYPEGLVLQK